jgi:hypothetical protein
MSDRTGKQQQTIVDPSLSTADDEDSSWQVQTKPRRLGPQNSLSRQQQQQQQQHHHEISHIPPVEESPSRVPAVESAKKKGMLLLISTIIYFIIFCSYILYMH